MNDLQQPRQRRNLGRPVLRFAAVVAAFGFGTLAPAVAAPSAQNARPWMSASLSPDLRALLVLAQMTLQEKVSMMHGVQSSYSYFVPGIPRLGIPPLVMGDDSAGVRLQVPAGSTGFNTTALPYPMALGATWNPQASALEGDVAGTEIRASGQDVLLGPGVDLIRQPWGGRIAEAASEDPLLISSIIDPYIEAVQAHNVVSTLKHYNVNNQEMQRLLGLNVLIDERTLQEIYSPPWHSAVSKANVGAVMCAFNKVNGVQSCENAHLLQDILKGQLGFKGWVMTDYGAAHSFQAVFNGLDQETPTAVHYGQELLDAVNGGTVSMATINEHVFRILRTMFAFGLFDNPPAVGTFPIALDDLKARLIEDQAITLLKNSQGLLPLSPSTVHSIAVIGGDANDFATAGGSSLVNNRTNTVTPLQGLQTRGAALGIQVQYSPGTDEVSSASMLPGPAAVSSSVLTPAGASSSGGLKAEYWTNTTFSGSPAYVRTDPQVALDLGFLGQSFSASTLPPPPTPYGSPISVRWTGTITPPTSGDYSFSLAGWGQERLYISGQLVIDGFSPHPPRVDNSSTLHLAGGQPYTIEIDYANTSPLGGLEQGTLQLEWTHPDNAYSPAMLSAAALAKKSDVAVVFVRDYNSEQRDRATLTLPNDQDQLIRAVEAANPRTIVVLTTGGPATMPWINQTPAVLEAWYGGQEQGSAIADVLFGAVNPSGHLPLTFPQSDAQVPLAESPWQQQLANQLDVPYTEGIDVGYRAYDRRGLQPLFPFGYGLSYTTFAFSSMHALGTINKQQELAAETGKAGANTAGIPVTFNLTNTGHREGGDVAQVYLGLPLSTGEPPKRLVGFQKVDLAPGQTKQVTVTLDPADHPFSYWDTNTNNWVIASGLYTVYVGDSSRNIALTGSFFIP